MKYLGIILVFMFSCSQVERVGEDGSSSWVSSVDDYVKTKKNIEVEVEADKLVVEQKDDVNEYFKDVNPKTGRGEVRRVEFLKSNKYRVKYAYALMEIDDNDKIMDRVYDIEISIFVDTGGGDWEDRECTWVEHYYDISPDAIEKEKLGKLKELNGEFRNLINEIIKNTNNE